MSTTTQNEIRKIIEESVVEEAAKPAPKKTAAPKAKLHNVKAKEGQLVKVEMSDDFMNVTQWVDGLNVYKRTRLPRPAHFPAGIAPFYIQDFAEFMRIASLGVSPLIQTDGTVKMGSDSVGTTDEMLGVVNVDLDTASCLISLQDFSVAKACADDMVKPSFNFAFFRVINGVLSLCATDSRRLHYTRFLDKDNFAPDGAFIPRLALEAKGEISLFAQGKYYIVTYDNVTLWYKRDEIQVLSDEAIKNVTVQDFGAAVEMGLAVPHLKLAAKNKTASHPVNIMREGEEARLDMRYPDVKGVARVPIVNNRDSFEDFGINAEYLLDAISFTGETILYQHSWQAAMSQMNVVSDDRTRVAVIMPIQLKSKED